MKNTLKSFLLIFAFCLLASNLFATETMGLYQAHNYKTPAKDSVTFIDSIAWSYTRPNYFNVQITFGRKDIKKNSKDGAMNTQFFMELTKNEYEKIFEKNIPLVGMPINDSIWDRKVSTRITPKKRIVTINFTNAIDAEITEVFKKGTLEIVFAKNQIESMKMRKERKRFLNIGGFKTFFVGESYNLRMVKKGLGLLDEGEMGRLLTDEAINKALNNKTAKGFNEAISAEKR